MPLPKSTNSNSDQCCPRGPHNCHTCRVCSGSYQGCKSCAVCISCQVCLEKKCPCCVNGSQKQQENKARYNK
ncbi:hypothetical protein SHELI_v1c07660 [Spiroplasma helicoides]|uniref:Uncharacterized protein n=1 Tax=Spiroplasma helicoides TaxID=216938 RepID=A0A1B3SLA8_9MOLU|nr:hypothetical protein [Spiroplasma helicoides]AOG60715.1 hypothetical protein SHELI_v1c07660 [Spiroplasma helicoides]